VKGEIMKDLFVSFFSVVVLCGMLAVPVLAQPVAAPRQPASGNAPAPSAVVVPTGYVIGPEDVLSVVFWKDKELSADVVVRPDGRISLPLLNDVQAAGLTPDELRSAVIKAATKFIEDPNATVVVKEIHSRKVFISGTVGKPGSYNIFGEKTVAQLIAEAGGLVEYADAKNIVIHRVEGGRTHRFRFNYKDFIKGKGLEQNIVLKPGDTVIVP
jgi:polysaccharide biosynthesis/export protein